MEDRQGHVPRHAAREVPHASGRDGRELYLPRPVFWHRRSLRALAAWIEANGYEYDGPMFNIYHVSPHETQDPQTFVTEACYPVRKKEAPSFFR